MNLASLTRYWKTVVAVLTAAVVVGNQIVGAVAEKYGDGTWDAQDTLSTVALVVGVVGVYLKANTPPTRQPADPNVSEQDPAQGLVAGQWLDQPSDEA